MAKAPALQFYPGDVQRDTALNSVSLAAYGLWHRMMWVMFDGTPYGHLSVNPSDKGSVIPTDKLARLLRVSEDELTHLLGELEEAGVFSRNEVGVIYSRRMVRDAKRRETNAANGSKGGNPRLSKSDKPRVNRKVKPLVADANAVVEGSSNSSGNGQLLLKPPVDHLALRAQRIEAFTAKCWEVNAEKTILTPIDLAEFIAYWTEAGDGQRQFRAEKQDSFQVDRRMVKWAGNVGKFTRKPTPTDRVNATLADPTKPIETVKEYNARLNAQRHGKPEAAA